MSRTSDQHLVLGMTRMGFVLVVLIAIAAGLSGVAIGLIADQRDDAETSRDAVAGQARQLADCVNDPATTQRDCEKKAEQVEQTIAEAVPGPAGAAGAAGAAGDDGQDGSDGLDGPQGPTGPQGPIGPRGPRGFIGPVGSTGAPGQDGADGIAGQNGQDGAQGATGETGSTGPQGPAGDRGTDGRDGTDGADGSDGQPGRGVEQLDCNPDTQEFEVVYTDGTRQPIEGSDCVADDGAPTDPGPLLDNLSDSKE